MNDNRATVNEIRDAQMPSVLPEQMFITRSIVNGKEVFLIPQSLAACLKAADDVHEVIAIARDLITWDSLRKRVEELLTRDKIKDIVPVTWWSKQQWNLEKLPTLTLYTPKSFIL
jgi:hypothetical protein